MLTLPLWLGCTRPSLVPQSSSGIYFAPGGTALSVHPGGTISVVPSSADAPSLPPGPHHSSAEVSVSPDGAVTLKLPLAPVTPLAGAVVILSADGAEAAVDWGQTQHAERGTEVFSR